MLERIGEEQSEKPTPQPEIPGTSRLKEKAVPPYTFPDTLTPTKPKTSSIRQYQTTTAAKVIPPQLTIVPWLRPLNRSAGLVADYTIT
ncbi:hypothetical protein DID88_002899 [Monilinia fructigena]|uniref:Uncharacterized protein n=1 Tax=Monilinia fructigena TaxID=38457 RepID=A0A395IP09_9HELO|nr:hypothetical protein DID88_002899 [Monilinia fructigena]